MQAAIERQGGGRIREIDATIAQRHTERGRQRADDEDYRRLCTSLAVKPGTTLETFLGSTRAAESRRGEVEVDKQQLDRLAIDKAVELKSSSERDKALWDEIHSLESRASNIPADNIRIRAALAEALAVTFPVEMFLRTHQADANRAHRPLAVRDSIPTSPKGAGRRRPKPRRRTRGRCWCGLREISSASW